MKYYMVLYMIGKQLLSKKKEWICYHRTNIKKEINKIQEKLIFFFF